MTCYIIDTETTGVEEHDQIIELGYTRWTFGSRPGMAINSYFSPSVPVALGAVATHHILPETYHACPPSSQAALPADCRHIIGHNVDFDWRMLGSPPVKRICTLAIARSLWPSLDSHKLGALVYSLHGVNERTKAYLAAAHGTIADISYCYDVLEAILAANPNIGDVERLWQYSEDCRIPRVMTFGKYKGRNIADVDRGWVTWYWKQDDTDPYLLEAFRRAGK